MNRTILHIDMNSYFASVEQAADPALRGKPIAVGGGIGKRTVIATSSYEARALGVKTGMPTWEALKLCPKLIIVAGDMEKYIYTSREIFAILREYTDLVEAFSIDEAFMDLTDTKERFGGEINAAQEIKDRIRSRFKITCSVGIGPNKLIAKMASELKKPDGLTSVTQEEIPYVLEFLPVEELCGIGRKLKKRLARLGIRTCGELSRHPVDKLIHHFGLVAGVHLSNMGKGINEDPVDPSNNYRDVKSISHSYTLPRDETDPAVIKSYMLRLSEQVGRRARKDRYKGRVVTAFVRYKDFSGFGRQKNIGEYIDDGMDIYHNAMKLIDIDIAPVRLLGVALSDLVRNADQITFIEPLESRKRSVYAMDEINSKYGEFTITRGSIIYNRLINKTGAWTKID